MLQLVVLAFPSSSVDFAPFGWLFSRRFRVVLSPPGEPARIPRARSTCWRALRLRVIALLTEKTRRNKDFPQLLPSASRRSLARVARLCLFRSRWTRIRPLLPFRCSSLGRLKVDQGASRLSDLLLIPDRRSGEEGGGGPRVAAEGAAKPDLMTRLCSAPRLLSGSARARQ